MTVGGRTLRNLSVAPVLVIAVLVLTGGHARAEPTATWNGTIDMTYSEQGESTFNANAVITGPTDFETGVSKSSLLGTVSGDYSEFDSECGFSAELTDPVLGEFSEDGIDANLLQIHLSPFTDSPDPPGTYLVEGFFVRLNREGPCSGYPNSDRLQQFPPYSVSTGLEIYEYSQTRFMLRLPTRGDFGPTVGPDGAKRWTGTQSYSEQFEWMSGPASVTWTYGLTLTPSGGLGCEIRAANPQRARSGKLVVRVLGRDKGCRADLTRTKLQIGKRIFSSIRKLPARQVGKGKTVSFEVPYGKVTLKRIRAALKKRTRVRAKAEFTIDGKADSVIVRVK